MDNLKFGTHDGVFHADDVIASVVLSTVYPDAKIVRTRDKEILSQCSLIFDVGGKYSPFDGVFDHHQKDAPVRENGVPYSSLGLIWLKEGVSFLKKLSSSSELDEKDLKKIASIIDTTIIETIDDIDNGGKNTKIPSNVKHLSLIISSFNPFWDEEDIDFDTAFFKAVECISVLFKRMVLQCVSKYIANKKVSMVIETTTDSFLELDRFYPYNVEEVPSTILYDIYPSKGGSQWNLRTIKVDSTSFESRKLLPEEFLNFNELCNSLNIEDGIFAHKGLFICASKTRDSIMKLKAFIESKK